MYSLYINPSVLIYNLKLFNAYSGVNGSQASASPSTKSVSKVKVNESVNPSAWNPWEPA